MELLTGRAVEIILCLPPLLLALLLQMSLAVSAATVIESGQPFLGPGVVSPTPSCAR
ncbi:hypothetical protein [Salipiger aestuarii]|uniref:hypothetical protein n=1 Tax=Salipiger aestuarii TaxID=568098 RepID=UPI001473947E|nr:hypothetical protein [Salipiger aestuarii]